jgi:hypothetical protein
MLTAIFLIGLEWGFKIYIVYLILKSIPKKEGWESAEERK